MLFLYKKTLKDHPDIIYGSMERKNPVLAQKTRFKTAANPAWWWIPQWPQELLAHSLVATPLNLLKHQNCHPEFRPIMTESWMILVHRCIFRTILLQNSYMFTCDVQQKKIPGEWAFRTSVITFNPNSHLSPQLVPFFFMEKKSAKILGVLLTSWCYTTNHPFPIWSTEVLQQTTELQSLKISNRNGPTELNGPRNNLSILIVRIGNLLRT